MYALVCLTRFALMMALVIAPSVAVGQLAGIDNPIPAIIEPGDTTVSLTEVASGLTAPIWAGSAPGVDNTLYVADQTGTIFSVTLGVTPGLVAPPTFADIKTLTGLATTLDQFQLLSVAFHPDYATNGFFYTYTLEPSVDPVTGIRTAADFSTLLGIDQTNAIHQTVLREWMVPKPTAPVLPVQAISRVLFRIDQPQLNNNGGAMGFDADGLLYIGIGDGGGIDDTDGQFFDDTDGQMDNPIAMNGHGTGNGQNKQNVLGSILRIDPRGTNAGSYGIPIDNPNVSGGIPVGGQSQNGGCQDDLGCDEIYAYGFHNPVQLSFESRGLLYVSDEGQSTAQNQNIEELDIVIAGGNYGWNERAGTFTFNTNLMDAGVLEAPIADDQFINPIAQYDHDEGMSVVGGFAYSGNSVPLLGGRYIFGDTGRPAPDTSNPNPVCAGSIFFLEFIQLDKETIEFLVGLNLLGFPDLSNIAQLQTVVPVDRCVLGFGKDATGEMYVLANQVGDLQSGAVLKIGLP